MNTINKAVYDWYRNIGNIPSIVDSPHRFGKFAAENAGMVLAVSELKRIKVTVQHAKTATYNTITKEIIIPFWYMSPKALEKYTDKMTDLDMTACSLALINGGAVHEALHARYSAEMNMKDLVLNLNSRIDFDLISSSDKALKKSIIKTALQLAEDHYVESRIKNDWIVIGNNIRFNDSVWEESRDWWAKEKCVKSISNLLGCHLRKDLELNVRKLIPNVTIILEQIQRSRFESYGSNRLPMLIDLIDAIFEYLKVDEPEDNEPEDNENQENEENGQDDKAESGEDGEDELGDGELGENEDGSADGDESGEGDESEDGDESNSNSDSNENGEDGDGENKSDSSDENGDESEDGEETQDEKEQKLVELGESDAMAEEIAEEFEREFSRQMYERQEKSYDASVFPKPEIRPLPEYNKRQLQKVVKDFKFIRHLSEMMHNNTRMTRPSTTGTKFRRSRIRHIATDSKIFQKKQDSKSKVKPEIMILVDGSGSMTNMSHLDKEMFDQKYSPNLIYGALSITKKIFDGLKKARVPVAVAVHTTGANDERTREVPVIYEVDSNLMSMKSKGADNWNKVQYIGKNNNMDGLAIEFCAKKYFSNKSCHKVMFVLSDGAPNGPDYFGTPGVSHTADTVEKLRKQGITIISISLVGSVVKYNNKIYGREFNVDGSNGLDEAMVDALQKILV